MATIKKRKIRYGLEETLYRLRFAKRMLTRLVKITDASAKTRMIQNDIKAIGAQLESIDTDPYKNLRKVGERNVRVSNG